MIARPSDIIREQMQYWEHVMKIPFLFSSSKSRCYLNGEAGDFMTNTNMIAMRELHYIKMVKDYIIKNKLHEKFKKVNKKQIKYFMYNSNLNSLTPAKNCYEIDLKSAYWEMANKLGLLRSDVYNDANVKDPTTGQFLISKKTRMACIGSLARRRSFYKFNGTKERRWKEPVAITAHIWDTICLEVSIIMQKAAKAAGHDFLFFWVDAAFVTSKSARDRVIKVFRKAGFNATITPISKIQVIHDAKKSIIQTTKPDKLQKIKLYPYSKKNRNVI